MHGTVHDASHSRGVQCFSRGYAKYPTLKSVFVDAGYGKTMLEFVENLLNKTIEISEPQNERCLPKNGFLNEPWLGSIIIQRIYP
ncbi:hypothetical protein [Holospora curviuscula]|uniref:Uncharacterized protein n=1 Tax=Holospora curviuscula TaxID=1082868 RepID=A0A2S5R9R8_9PROT|nr:hypothetical protein [Holospora curviuscula]PPE03875.1 hypothetical protein HCUR_00653 [Holospora curviuscula]